MSLEYNFIQYFRKLTHASDYTSLDFWSFGNAEFASKYHKLKIMSKYFLITFSVIDKLSSEKKKYSAEK